LGELYKREGILGRLYGDSPFLGGKGGASPWVAKVLKQVRLQRKREDRESLQIGGIKVGPIKGAKEIG